MSQADGDLLVSSLREMANLQYLDLAGNNIMLNVSSQGTSPFCESGLFSLSYLRMSGNPLNTSLAPCLTGPGTTCPVCICLKITLCLYFLIALLLGAPSSAVLMKNNCHMQVAVSTNCILPAED